MSPLRWPILLAAAIRSTLLCATYVTVHCDAITAGDSGSYLDPGLHLFRQGAFTMPNLFGHAQPEIDRTPGYPIFAMITGMAWGNALLAVTVQIAISLLSLVLIARIARRVLPSTAAASNPSQNIPQVAAWLYALEPLSIVYTIRLMPESLFTCLLLFAIERLLTYQATARWNPLVVSAFALVAASYVRPVSYYLIPLIAIGIAITSTGQRRWQAPAILLAIAAPCLAAWQLRNFAETGYGGFSSIVETNLYFYQSAGITAELEQTSLPAIQQRLGNGSESAYLAAHPEQAAWSQSQRLQWMHTQSVSILRAHQILYLRSHFAGVAVVLFAPCAAEWLELFDAYPKGSAMPRHMLNQVVEGSGWRNLYEHPAIAAFRLGLELPLLVLYILALRGSFSTAASRLPLLTLISVALYFILISGGTQGGGRYRLPVMPIVCILAAAGLTSVKRHKSVVNTFSGYQSIARTML